MKHKACEYEFLPAALEVQESPPSPLGRIILWTIILLLASAVAWACIGKIDIVAVAPGKIIPGGRSKVIQPLEIGTVRTIHVEESQVVHKGEVLIELDATSTDADQERIREELLTAELEQVRAQSIVQALDNGSHPPEAVPWPAGAGTEVIAIYDKWIQGQLREQRARQAALDDDIQVREAELSATQATINKLERTLPLITERVASLGKLAAKGMAARAAFLELEQRRIETEQDLATARERVQGIRAAIRERHQQRHAAAAEFMNTALRQVAEAERRIRVLRQELLKAERRSRLQILTAPVSGVVQQLAVHTLGGVVTPAQPLMVIVPQDHDIEIEATIANKDIGFVHAGQSARVKVDAFPFTRYGIVDAKLRAVSLDAVADEKRGLVYSARVALNKNTISVGDKQVNLAPGMTVTVEIRTGERRLIEYFLSPLMQYVDESLRER